MTPQQQPRHHSLEHQFRSRPTLQRHPSPVEVHPVHAPLTLTMSSCARRCATRRPQSARTLRRRSKKSPTGPPTVSPQHPPEPTYRCPTSWRAASRPAVEIPAPFAFRVSLPLVIRRVPPRVHHPAHHQCRDRRPRPTVVCRDLPRAAPRHHRLLCRRLEHRLLRRHRHHRRRLPRHHRRTTHAVRRPHTAGVEHRCSRVERVRSPAECSPGVFGVQRPRRGWTRFSSISPSPPR